MLNTAPLWHQRRQNGWAGSRHETSTSSLLFFSVVSPAQVGEEMRRMARLCLADLRPIAGFAGASDERGGGDVKAMWVSVFIRGLGGRWRERTKASPRWVAAWTWQTQSTPHALRLAGGRGFRVGVLGLWRCPRSPCESLLWLLLWQCVKN